jgi:sugar phosphate isomerase/epimerase
MSRFLLSLTLLLMLGSMSAYSGFVEEAMKSHPPTDAYDGWHLAMQAWTFNKYTFADAIEKTASLGLDWIEAFPGQVVSKDHPDWKMDPSMTAEQRAFVKDMLAKAAVRLVNFGVTELTKDEKQCRKVFDFARDMGIQTIVAEPPEESLDMIQGLCKEYNIKVAIHNHPKQSNSHYWNPELILKVSKNRAPWIGACADIGHWARSGVRPIDGIKMLKGHIISLHFKDLNEFGKVEAHDVPWGTGISDIKAVLKELHKQKFNGVFSIEYEYNWENSVPEIRKCVDLFNKEVGAFKKGGWTDLLLPDLSDCVYKPNSWTMAEGVLSANGGDDIWTKQKYGNFVLDLEFKLDTATNSGVFLRTGDIKEWLHTAIEVQILDSYGRTQPSREDCGAIFDCLAPTTIAVHKPGEWNHYTITCKDNKIYVVLNGTQIIDMDLNRWTQAHKNPDGTPNKFNNAYKNMPRVGNIGLQYHGHPIWFRNLKIRTI